MVMRIFAIFCIFFGGVGVGIALHRGDRGEGFRIFDALGWFFAACGALIILIQ